ncbi:alpha/beta hydrolase [Tumidithrix helvetica PCC 7403]|uniref:alpha/beta fold hydrolase n=1 Tax=Tumidithrix helvetica TaxID=3457545 RepID=UPI003C8235D2
MSKPDRYTLDLPNLRLSYLVWGQGREPLLCLHGMADCGLVWSHLGQSLSDRYCVVAPDLRGHGESDKPADYSFDSIIDDLEALMQALGWESAHILAHSWSAKTVALWAQRSPHRFKSLILVDPFFMGRFPSWVRLTFPLFYRVLPFLKLVGKFPSYEVAEQIARTLKQYRGWTALQQEVFRATIAQQVDGSWQSKFPENARDRIFEAILSIDGLTAAIAVPTLFVKPQQGLNRMAWQLQPYKTYCLNLQIREVPSNHWAFLVEPEAFDLEIVEFLNSLDY